MEIKDFLKKTLPQIPPEIAASLIKNEITRTPFDQKNDVLSDADLQTEIGYAKMDDGTYLV